MISGTDKNNLKNIITPAIRKIFNQDIKSIKRFETGFCHYVYDIVLSNGENMVFRIGEKINKSKIEGSIFWYDHLRNLGIKIPKMFYSDTSCEIFELPFMISERLIGNDIGNVFDDLSDSDLDEIAKEIVEVQDKIITLGIGSGYGEAINFDEEGLYDNWFDFINTKISESKKNIEKIGIFDIEYFKKIQELTERNMKYFKKVKPIPFFDDLTSKNVIINEKKFNGVVDFDTMTFGDRLYWLGLTNMAFTYLGRKTYIESIIKYLNLDIDQIKIMNYYTLLFCLNFMSEIGQKFNKDEMIIDEKKISRYKEIFNELVNKI